MPAQDASKATDALIRRVNAVIQRELRGPLIRRLVDEMGDALLLEVLSELLDRARMGDHRARRVSQELALEPALVTHLPYDRLKALFALATERGMGEVRNLFLSPRAPENLPASHEDNEHLELPLGVRRQAARTRDRFLIDRLLRDRNHMVIRNLLRNPRITVQDVITIAAMRPTRPEVLLAVAENHRWSSRYVVRKALACNPYTPSNVALGLVSTLMEQDLRFIVGAGQVSADVRAEASRRLRANSAIRQVYRAADRQLQPRGAPAEVGAEVDALLDTWRQAPEGLEAAAESDVDEVAFFMPTTEAIRFEQAAADRVAEEHVRRRRLGESDDPFEAPAPAPGQVRAVDEVASLEEMEAEVDQLLSDWAAADDEISDEMMAEADNLRVEAVGRDAAPLVFLPEGDRPGDHGWRGLPELDLHESLQSALDEALSQEPAGTPPPAAAASEAPLSVEVARLIGDWRARDGSISADLMSRAAELEVRAVGRRGSPEGDGG